MTGAAAADRAAPPPTRRQQALWTLALVGVTFVWGSTFVVVKEAVDRLPVFAFNAWRFALAAVALGLVVRHQLRRLGRTGVRRGVLLGGALWAGYAFQTFGLTRTTAPKAAFITGMVVVITPLLQAAVLRRTPSVAAGGGAVVAAVGLALLTLEGSVLPASGDLLVLGCAVSFSVHLLGLAAWSPLHPVGALAAVQLAAAGALHLAAGALQDVATGTYAWRPPDPYVWLTIAFTAIFASALAFLAQTGAQRVLSPTRVAITFTMEPVFAWLTSAVGVPLLVAAGLVGLDAETFGARAAVGAVLIVAAMLWSELGSSEPADALAAPETAALSGRRAGRGRRPGRASPRR